MAARGRGRGRRSGVAGVAGERPPGGVAAARGGCRRPAGVGAPPGAALGRPAPARRWAAPPDAAAATVRRRGPRCARRSRLGAAAPCARLAATVVTLGLSAAFVLLLLSLASELNALADRSRALGRRYQLTATLPAARRRPRSAGSPACGPLAALRAAGGRLVLARGDDRRDRLSRRPHAFEAPPLLAGHRPHGRRPDRDRRGSRPGARARRRAERSRSQLPSGPWSCGCASRAWSARCEHEAGSPTSRRRRCSRDDPGAPPALAIRRRPGPTWRRISRALTALGAAPAAPAGRRPRACPGRRAARDRAGGRVVDGLVCLYALVQACALTVQERRRTVAVLRAAERGAGAVRRLLAGADLVPARPRRHRRRRARAARARSRARRAWPPSYVTLPLQAGRRRDRGHDRRPAAGRRDRGAVGRAPGRRASRSSRGSARERAPGSRRITRRRALAEALGAASGLRAGLDRLRRLGRADRRSGSTRETTWATPSGRRCACSARRARCGPGGARPAAARRRRAATLAHVTDAHVLDASSRRGSRSSTGSGRRFSRPSVPGDAHRPGARRRGRRGAGAARPTVVIQGGDLIDNVQHNELVHALAVLRGGRVEPGQRQAWLLRRAVCLRHRSLLLPARRRRPAPPTACCATRSLRSQPRAGRARCCRSSAITTPSSPATVAPTVPPARWQSVIRRCGTCRPG